MNTEIVYSCRREINLIMASTGKVLIVRSLTLGECLPYQSESITPARFSSLLFHLQSLLKLNFESLCSACLLQLLCSPAGHSVLLLGVAVKIPLPTIHSATESGGLSDVFVLRSSEFLGESDEKPFRPADVAEPIRVFILDYVAYELRAALAEPFKRLVNVVHGEHDAQVA